METNEPPLFLEKEKKERITTFSFSETSLSLSLFLSIRFPSNTEIKIHDCKITRVSSRISLQESKESRRSIALSGRVFLRARDSNYKTLE